MEAACSVDRALNVSAIGSGHKSPAIAANSVRNGGGLFPPVFLSASKICSSSSPSQHCSLKHFQMQFFSLPELGPAVVCRAPDAAMNSECYGGSGGGPFRGILASSGNKKFYSGECRNANCVGNLGSFVHCRDERAFDTGEWRSLDAGGLHFSLGVSMMATVGATAPTRFGSQGHGRKMTLLGCRFLGFDRSGEGRERHQFCVCFPNGKGFSRGFLRQVCKATGQSGTGQSAPEDENTDHISEQRTPPPSGENSESPSPVNSDPAEVDWRVFRAKLVVTEHTITSPETSAAKDEEKPNSMSLGSLGTRWAHPILAPEAGCVLIATDKIDGQQSFERSVILLLSPGSSKPREGPYGLILNMPLTCRIKDIKPKDQTLVKFFGNCQVNHGGPLDEDLFLLIHGIPGVKGYREVIPGVYFGAAGGLEEIVRGERPLDYRFFFGYSGWSVEQLRKEIAAGLWCVAACSTDLITGHSAAGLWEEILLLMGGKYVELSKRPRRRHF